MTPSKSPAKPCLMLSCSNAWSPLARRVAQDLERCGIEIRLDPWDGGGGIPSRQIITQGPEDTAGVLVLLTPSNVARTWIGESWKQRSPRSSNCAQPARAARARGGLHTIPGFLESQSFADLRYRDYALETERLVESIRDHTGDPRISLPATERIPSQPQLPTAPLVTPVVLETGSSLAHHFSNDALGHLKSEVVPLMRDGLHYELGVPFPGLHVRAVPARRLNAVRMLINDVPEAEFDIPPGRVMVNDDTAAMASRGFDTLPGLNPANGNPTTWIPSEDARTAAARGLTLWDAAGYVVLALSALLRNRAASFVGVEETQSMLASLARAFPHLVAETVPARVSALVLADVLRRLVTEHVSIRNLRRILMAVGTWAPPEPDPVYLTEYVRAALQRDLPSGCAWPAPLVRFPA